MGEVEKLSKESVPSNKVGLPFGLAHAGGGEWDDDGIVPQEGDDSDAADFHIELLLLLLIDLALRLMNLEKVLDDWLVDVMAYGILDLLHVMIEFVGRPGGRAWIEIEQLGDELLGFVFF